MPKVRAAHPILRDSAAAGTPTSRPPSNPGDPAPAAPAAGTPAWLAPFFAFAGACPFAARLLRPLACAVVPVASPSVAAAIRMNSQHIFGRSLTASEGRQFARRVVGSFYDFVLDVARTSRMSAGELVQLVEQVEGLEQYNATRLQRRGAILVTAHLGTFEAGLAALARQERTVRVVFKRDPVAAFEQLRSKLRRSLGVVESPIDDGISTWLSLRDALRRDEVVVMQGDRAVPGQRSEIVPFLHGHLRLPTGPVRLACITGSPIIPVFAIPSRSGRYRVLLKPAIRVDGLAQGPSAALQTLAASIAEVVAAHPHQWLALEPLFHEDIDHAQR